MYLRVFACIFGRSDALHFSCIFHITENVSLREPHLISKGKIEYFKDQEFRYYFFLAIIFSLLFFINISASNSYGLNIATFKHSAFTAISLLTTTGFSTENFNDWPAFSNMLVFVLLFIGGSAGSTTGGLKIIRTIVILKFLVFEIKKLIHSKGVFNVTLGKKVISDDIVRATLGFYMFYIFIFISTALLLSSTGLDFITSLSASAAAIGNIGPGLGDVGPSYSWAGLTVFAKYISAAPDATVSARRSKENSNPSVKRIVIA